MGGGVGGGADPLDGGVRHDVHVHVHHRDGDRHVDLVAQPVAEEGGELSYLQVDGVVGGHDVGPAAHRGVVVGEDGGHVAEVDPLQRVEGEVLVVEAERNLLL